MMIVPGVPYWRLSGFYFFYFAVVGSLTPFLGLYLTDIGHSAQVIGWVNAILMATKIVAPNVWGWLCDRTGKRLLVIAFGSFWAWIFFGGLFFWQSLWAVLIITALYSFFWNAVLSQFDAVTIQYLHHDSHRYSQVRLWGSIGFIVFVAGLGVLFDSISVSYLPIIIWVLLGLLWLSCCSVKEPPAREVQHEATHWFRVLKKPAVILFFSATLLLQFSFGGYYAFFSLYLDSMGYSRSVIGLLWALGVVAEVVLFLLVHRLMPKLGAVQLLGWSLLITAGRWLLIAFLPEYLSVLIVAQCLHAFSFGAAHAASIELIRQFFCGTNSGQGQALYSALTFGIGGALGAISSGALWGINPQLLYVSSAIASLLAALILYGGCKAGAFDMLKSR